MEFVKKISLVFFLSFHIFSSVINAFPVNIRLYTPNYNGILDAQLDAAGYSDVILWGYSDYHPHSYHELLSGEWGAAIYYDDNPKAPNAMWLTDLFQFPNWPTGCDFWIVSYQDWNDTNNPVIGIDTGRSVIRNNQIEITIDYEIADLNEKHFSPLSYREPGNDVTFARSERYVLLQTYTIKNIKASGNITGLEFYQMLHSHGADDYGPVVHCSYQTASYLDVLANYTPYNPVHRVGNFRYDITQWNDLESELDHIDWVGFSSTVEPNVYECNYYAGGHSYDVWKPPTGTHIDIEQRNLDGSTYSYGETAGAMGWFLPTLEPNQTTSITVAFMFGTTDWPCPAILTKDDNIPDDNCVLPGSPITYTIHYDANGLADNNVAIIDYLPDEVYYNSSSHDANYDPDTRTVIWTLGSVPDDYNATFTLNVNVNNQAEPCGVIINICEVKGDVTYQTAEVNTPVCFWCPQPGIIYVDDNATGNNTGMSWENAYFDLQTALNRAANGCDAEIWAAKGTYFPSVPDPYGYGPLTFYLINDVPVYGHFEGYETSVGQRNLKDPCSQSVLTGIDYPASTNYVVSAYGSSQNNIIDGFTIMNDFGNGGNGVLIKNASLKVFNCLISSCTGWGGDVAGGIFAENSNVVISDCTIQNNSVYGINATFNDNPSLSQPLIENNIIRNNSSTGIYLNYFKIPAFIINNLIYRNNADGISSGLSDWPSPVGRLQIRNNTIFGNNGYGITTNNNIPTITNCVVWNNNYEIISDMDVKYSCVEGGYPGPNNISTEPCFVDVNVNNFHLKQNSPCIDKGKPNSTEANELDIDGEDRLADGDNNGTFIVDIGADEVYWPKADFNGDEIVNFLDFAKLMEFWQEPNEPNKSLDADTDVDIDDLALFCDDWLWVAPWSELYALLMEQSQGSGDIMSESTTETLGMFAEDISADSAEEETIEIIDQPFSDEQIQAMIDWTEQLWESNEDLRAMVAPEDYQRVLESLQNELDN